MKNLYVFKAILLFVQCFFLLSCEKTVTINYKHYYIEILSLSDQKDPLIAVIKKNIAHPGYALNRQREVVPYVEDNKYPFEFDTFHRSVHRFLLYHEEEHQKATPHDIWGKITVKESTSSTYKINISFFKHDGAAWYRYYHPGDFTFDRAQWPDDALAKEIKRVLINLTFK